MTTKKHVCIHGHFYQPPRENPWLNEVELQDSAYPYHDWNERITAECYARNSASRIQDHEGRILDIGRRGNDVAGSHDELHGLSSREECATGIQRDVDRHDFAGLQLLLPGTL